MSAPNAETPDAAKLATVTVTVGDVTWERQRDGSWFTACGPDMPNNDSARDFWISWLSDQHDLAIDALLAVCAERDEARKDAERWREMRVRYVGLDFAWGDPPLHIAAFALPCGRFSAGIQGADAIADAAREGAP